MLARYELTDKIIFIYGGRATGHWKITPATAKRFLAYALKQPDFKWEYGVISFTRSN